MKYGLMKGKLFSTHGMIDPRGNLGIKVWVIFDDSVEVTFPVTALTNIICAWIEYLILVVSIVTPDLIFNELI